MKPLRAAFSLFVLAVSAAAAPVTRDLGEGLTLLRARELPVDLPAAEPGKKGAVVLDLRYAKGEREGVAALSAWLKARASLRTPVFVLANSDTAEPLRGALAAEGALPGVLVIGVATRGFRPDIAIEISPENERRAYEALEDGAPLASLLVENPDKIRNDEASLSRDRLADASAADTKKRPPPPPLDLALQRAVHLHRALVALKKI